MSDDGRSDDMVRAQVRARYARAANEVLESSRRRRPEGGPRVHDDSPSPPRLAEPALLETGMSFGSLLYPPGELRAVPRVAVAASLGCGCPSLVADLQPGERVLDLGSGGGLDAILAANRVGRQGHVIGIDMTEEMLELSRINAKRARLSNVTFLKGTIEAIPMPDGMVDVVISNCSINLSPDKPAVFAESFRVLIPGGRLAVSDIVSEDRLSPAERLERVGETGCSSGTLSRTEYQDHLREAGFDEVSVTFTHRAADGMHGAVVKAVKPRIVEGDVARPG